MNEEELYSNILSIEGDISELETEIDTLAHYATYILCNTENLQEQIEPLEDKLAELQAKLSKLYNSSN